MVVWKTLASTNTFSAGQSAKSQCEPMVAQLLGHYERALTRAPVLTTGAVAGVLIPQGWQGCSVIPHRNGIELWQVRLCGRCVSLALRLGVFVECGIDWIMLGNCFRKAWSCKCLFRSRLVKHSGSVPCKHKTHYGLIWNLFPSASRRNALKGEVASTASPSMFKEVLSQEMRFCLRFVFLVCSCALAFKLMFDSKVCTFKLCAGMAGTVVKKGNHIFLKPCIEQDGAQKSTFWPLQHSL